MQPGHRRTATTMSSTRVYAPDRLPAFFTHVLKCVIASLAKAG
jgi:hypothetical protein